jgi:hypothetical protein
MSQEQKQEQEQEQEQEQKFIAINLKSMVENTVLWRLTFSTAFQSVQCFNQECLTLSLLVICILIEQLLTSQHNNEIR